MKADSGTWVYIILSVVFLIISALGKKKQQPVVAKHESEDEEFDTPSDNEPPRKWPKSLEDVFPKFWICLNSRRWFIVNP
ncbi:MAG: hypothetical protein HC905_05480 [Bacteroidales bacterium]|nr:hypothetical protein [Bacteroidales bacterium]